MLDIEYFYSAHSGYAYIGSARLMAIASAQGRRLLHKPMDLRRAVAATGPGPTNSLTPQRSAYFSRRSISRWAEWRGVDILPHSPTPHHHDIARSNGMLIAGLQRGINIDQLAHVLLEGHWRDDADLDDRDTLIALGNKAGVDAETLVNAAMDPDVQAIYEDNTNEAIRRSVFGSPTYFVDGDMFYGQDHLELVEHACSKPFVGTWPPAEPPADNR